VVSSHLSRSSSILVCSSRSHIARSARCVAVSESFADSAAASRVRKVLVSSWAEARSDSRSLSLDFAASRSASKALHLRFWAVLGGPGETRGGGSPFLWTCVGYRSLSWSDHRAPSPSLLLWPTDCLRCPASSHWQLSTAFAASPLGVAVLRAHHRRSLKKLLPLLPAETPSYSP
jgi:hypothetical protein